MLQLLIDKTHFFKIRTIRFVKVNMLFYSVTQILEQTLIRTNRF